MGGDLVVYDPRFAAINLPGLREERGHINDLNVRILELEEEINRLTSQLNLYDFLKGRVVFECARDLKPINFIKCKITRERFDCNCAARKIWLSRYIL